MRLQKKNILTILFASCAMATILSTVAGAGGISFDTGLTPPEERWILRTQMRYMQKSNDPTPMNREMSTFMFPVVLAYGLRSDLAVIIRQTVLSQEMSMAKSTDNNSGLGDLFVLAKYRAYRINTPDYTFGIAPSLGLKLPTGKDSFSSETWDMKTGLYFSGRSGPWASDFDVAYSWNGFSGKDKNGRNPGDEITFDLAFAYQFSIGKKAQVSLAPVLELNYKNIREDRLDGHDVMDTGEKILLLSPGIQFITASFILEVLYQNPVWQRQKGSQLERDAGLIVGVRFLF